MAASYKTVQGCAASELVEKKSRFIAQISHVETEQEALAFLEEVRGAHPMARHHVYAYIVRGAADAEDACRIRYSDDGEPARSAGMPVLEVIRHAELSNVVAVVTRYFGGTLLGYGGLVRAYTHTTQSALEAATVVTIERCVDIDARVAYALYDQMLHLARTEDARVVDTDFTDVVCMKLRVVEDAQDALLEKIADATGGQADTSTSEPFEAIW